MLKAGAVAHEQYLSFYQPAHTVVTAGTSKVALLSLLMLKKLMICLHSLHSIHQSHLQIWLMDYPQRMPCLPQSNRVSFAAAAEHVIPMYQQQAIFMPQNARLWYLLYPTSTCCVCHEHLAEQCSHKLVQLTSVYPKA